MLNSPQCSSTLRACVARMLACVARMLVLSTCAGQRCSAKGPGVVTWTANGAAAQASQWARTHDHTTVALPGGGQLSLTRQLAAAKDSWANHSGASGRWTSFSHSPNLVNVKLVIYCVRTDCRVEKKGNVDLPVFCDLDFDVRSGVPWRGLAEGRPWAR